jgi:hypothetical protein
MPDSVEIRDDLFRQLHEAIADGQHPHQQSTDSRTTQ